MYIENRTKFNGKPAITQMRLAAYSSSSPRSIRIGQLNVLPHLHLRPINHIVYVGSYLFKTVGNLILGWTSRLDAFSVYSFRT